ncbi:MAG: hypothetical protein Q4A22_07395 [Kocuria sp.]|nr:hypothetical protein [Kocuria sp.]
MSGTSETTPPEGARRRPEQDATPLPETGALRNLVELLLSRGADRARLTLVQSGNIMTHQTRQSVGQAQDEVENGTVDQGSPLFDDVADLYTQAMSTPVGPWRQLDLSVSPAQEGRREVTVTYDFPNGETRTEHYAQGGAPTGNGLRAAQGDARPDAEQHRGEQLADAQPADSQHATEQSEEHRASTAGVAAGTAAAGTAPAAREAGTAGGQGLDEGHGTSGAPENRAPAGTAPATERPETDEAVAGTTQPLDAAPVDAAPTTGAAPTSDDAPRGADDDAVRLADEQPARPAQDGEVVAGTGAAAPVVVEAAPATPTRESADNGQPVMEPAPAEPAVADPAVPVDTDAHDAQALTGATPEDSAAHSHGTQDLPAHVDESDFGTETVDPLVPSGTAGAARDVEDDPASAPQLATATDVSPSYRAPQTQQELDQDALAPGNLVLTTGDVLARLAEAQRHLFGPEGTARDVSTVLIRVRALGTYYDALTHVRLNGFWDQRPTFDLVPEEQLRVQELKDDSYLEGSGAPLAMMFRFRPGVPPEVSFDYSDEEAFVRYEQRLPGQNYLEELRMYPRTGSNIPQHVNDALQDWNY